MGNTDTRQAEIVVTWPQANKCVWLLETEVRVSPEHLKGQSLPRPWMGPSDLQNSEVYNPLRLSVYSNLSFYILITNLMPIMKSNY